MKNKSFIYFLLLFFACQSVMAQRSMENLDRGVVATKVDGGVYVNWRITGQEWYGVSYNLYRDGTKINATPITGASNFVDAAGTLSSKYKVSPIVNGVELLASKEVAVLQNPWIDIQLREIPKIAGVPDSYYNGYTINDITTADLDGDGEYELIVKRRNEEYDPENPFENKYYTLIEAYKLDGTHMWTIDIGPNMIHNVEVNVLAFDFDGDGKAEVVLRTSEGSVDGLGNVIGDIADANGLPNPDGKTNYRDSFELNNSWFESKGPEFLSLFDGVTGKELDRVDHIAREPFVQWGIAGHKPAQLAHRATKFHYGAPYLDGKKPSVFISRGIYHQIKMSAYDVVNKKFVKKWDFSSSDAGNQGYAGQGNHNYSIADVDNDGCDEIVYGSMVVDNDGKGLYTTGLGHGDAIHVGNFDPYRKGLEVFACLENSPHWGASLRAAESGIELWHHDAGRDMGRCMAANISNAHKGVEVWDNDVMFSSSERTEISTPRGSSIFRIYWDGDLLEELVDHVWDGNTRKGTGSIMKLNNNNVWETSLLANGHFSCNDTKGTPCLQADLFGDWREEIIWRSADESSIRIYFSTIPTEHRIYTLMHDMQYRQAIAWQMCGYNQPPHVSYFLGEQENILLPPPPVISNGRLVFQPANEWNSSAQSWTKDGVRDSFSNGQDVLFDVTSANNGVIALRQSVSPNNMYVNSTGVHEFDMSSGKLTGAMKLVKQGAGTLKINGVHDYVGDTEIWDGLFDFDGTLQQSKVWLNLFGELSAKGTIAKGVDMRYGSVLYPGKKDEVGSLNIGESLTVESASVFEFDFGSSLGVNDKVIIGGDFTFEDDIVIKVHKMAATILPGEYEIIDVAGNITGDISKVKVEGILDYPLSVSVSGSKVILTVQNVRNMASVQWKGDKNNGIWDLANTENFTLNGNDAYFVAYDNILFDDNAVNKTVNLVGALPVKDITVNSTSNYVFTGDGKIIENASITKRGSGKLKLNANNEYTGATIVENGILEVESLPILAGSSIGMGSDNPEMFILNGGTLQSSGNALSTTTAIKIGEKGGTFNTNANFIWNGIVSGGVLTKTGASELIMYGKNTHQKTILKEGVISFKTDDANPGNDLVFENGTLYCLDGINSYNSAYWNVEVPSGKSGSLYLDGRCDYYGTLKGSGDLNLYISFVRSVLRGDWSSFSGKLTVGTYARNAKDLYFDNNYGLPNAELNIIGDFSGIYNNKKTTFKLGGITGGENSKLTGAHAWEIGNRNTQSIYKGTITAGSIIKVGTGDLTLTGNNTYTGGTTVKAGRLLAENTAGSATGSGPVVVESGASIGGSGSFGGTVTIASGGRIDMANNDINQLDFPSGLILSPGSKLIIDVNEARQSSDVINASNVVVAGTLDLNLLELSRLRSADTSDGTSFQIFQSDNGATVTGTFDAITPTLPSGYSWDQSQLQDGKISIRSVTSVNVDEFGKMKIYPNPVKDILNLQLGEFKGKLTARLLSSTGQICLILDQEYSAPITWNVSSLASGIYVLELNLDGQKFTYQINKN